MDRLFLLLVFLGSNAVVYGQNAEGLVRVNPDSLDFGVVKGGQRPSREVRIDNVCDEPIELVDVLASCGCLDVEFSKGIIPPGKHCRLKVIVDASLPTEGSVNSVLFICVRQGDSPVLYLPFKVGYRIRLDDHALSRNVFPQSLKYEGVDIADFPINGILVVAGLDIDHFHARSEKSMVRFYGIREKSGNLFIPFQIPAPQTQQIDKLVDTIHIKANSKTLEVPLTLSLKKEEVAVNAGKRILMFPHAIATKTKRVLPCRKKSNIEVISTTTDSADLAARVIDNDGVSDAFGVELILDWTAESRDSPGRIRNLVITYTDVLTGVSSSSSHIVEVLQ